MEKIKKIKNLFNKFNLDGYLVPKNDEFFNEFVPKNKDNLKFISNFSGSYGFALILKKNNYLFVDGRYTLQAKLQCGTLFKILTLPHKLPFDILKSKNISIGFDPKLHTKVSLDRIFQKTNCKLIPINKNLIEKIWGNKSKINSKKFFVLKDKYIGQSSKVKINQLIKSLKKNKVDLQFISSSENIAWLLNIRGNDSEFTPIPNCYAIVDGRSFYLFCNLTKIDNKFKKLRDNIKILNINNLEFFLKNLKNKKVQIDSNSCSILFRSIIKKNNHIFEIQDPIYLSKSIKNKIEIKNTLKAHIYDGAALTKFLFWIQNNFRNTKITEIDAQEKLLQFRQINKTFKTLSFPTISGSGPNGSIIHYKATKKTNRVLSEGDIYLIDSGGQYNFGTTDVTRTISLNNKSNRIKDIYTRVLKGHIGVASYKFNKKTSGSEIDVVARKYLKQIHLDYAHGTGHGVGFYLNVHEGPHGISKGNSIRLREGMILSNEPGYYEDGKFGIRIENLITVKKIRKITKFENLTMAPIDKTLINKELLNAGEINWLNNYHNKVFKNLKSFMNRNELIELKNSCSNI